MNRCSKEERFSRLVVGFSREAIPLRQCYLLKDMYKLYIYKYPIAFTHNKPIA